LSLRAEIVGWVYGTHRIKWQVCRMEYGDGKIVIVTSSTEVGQLLFNEIAMLGKRGLSCMRLCKDEL